MNLLGVIHGGDVRAGVFGPVVEARGHRLEEWSLGWDTPLSRPLDSYGGVLVFGGAMHADQEGHHPWLREENLFLQRLLDLHTPVLGICLGAQLVAKAAHAPVRPADSSEIGWYPVELTHDADSDPLLGGLPQRFDSFQWHHYTYDVPAGGVELARSDTCTQAFRLGDSAWGVQFHPEVTFEQVERWADEPEEVPVDTEALLTETRKRIAAWNELGRGLCNTFVDVVERVAAPA
jgi:GMP synthase (glutamine-hydrolysing)